MTIHDLIREVEDELAPMLAWSSLKQALAYKVLYAMGQRMDGIEQRVTQLAHEELVRRGC